MLSSFLVRASIDWVRHNEDLKNSNPYSRCEESVKVCQGLWEEQIGAPDLSVLEPAIVTSYWEEFFHAEDPLLDEKEWREGLTKRSGQYDSFDQWQDWFKKKYAKVYKDNNIWQGILMTAWAHTHQYEVACSKESWDFRPSRSYLPTAQMWRLEPHIDTAQEVLKELLLEETRAYEETGFTVQEHSIPAAGRIECLGFDTRKYSLTWPPRAKRQSDKIEVGAMVADIIVPAGDDWYRHPDNIIFAHECIDVTALINRAKYIFGSQRRLFELIIDNGFDKAKIQASAEGWLVPDLQS